MGTDYLFDDSGCRSSLHIWKTVRLLRDIGPDNIFFLPVPALDEHIGLQGFDQTVWRLLIEDRHIVDHAERFQYHRPVVFPVDRSSRLYAGDGTVGIDAYN